MKKFVCAAILTIAAVGVALADEFPAMIVKCDADKGCIEYKKVSGKGKDKKVDETAVKIDLAKNCKIVKGKFDKDAMKIVDGDPIEKGLKDDVFKNEKGTFGILVVADDGADKGKVTKITVFGFGKKKDKN